MNIPYQILELEPEPLLILTRNEMENPAVLASVLDEMVPSSLSAVNNILLLAARWLQTATWQSQVWLLTVERPRAKKNPQKPKPKIKNRVKKRIVEG